MAELKLKIVTPDRVFFDDEVDMLIARGLSGDFAIMKNHIPLMAVLDIRALRIKKNNVFRNAAIAGGYLTLKDNQIIIMSSACEWADEIDIERALEAKRSAEERIANAKKNHESDLDKAEISLKKAINRIKVKDNK